MQAARAEETAKTARTHLEAQKAARRCFERGTLIGEGSALPARPTGAATPPSSGSWSARKGARTGAKERDSKHPRPPTPSSVVLRFRLA